MAENDGPGTRGDFLLDLLTAGEMEALLRLRGDRNHHAAHRLNKGLIVRVEGFGDEHLVARIANCHQRMSDSLAGAVGDQDIPTLELHPVPPVVADYRVDQRRITVGRAVRKHIPGVGAHGLEEAGRRFDIGLTDVQMINRSPVAFRLLGIGDEPPYRGCLHPEYSLRKFHILNSCSGCSVGTFRGGAARCSPPRLLLHSDRPRYSYSLSMAAYSSSMPFRTW